MFALFTKENAGSITVIMVCLLGFCTVIAWLMDQKMGNSDHKEDIKNNEANIAEIHAYLQSQSFTTTAKDIDGNDTTDVYNTVNGGALGDLVE
jgi:hypothetical protein